MRVYHPVSVVAMAFLAVLLGAWTVVVAFVGPAFGYRATATQSWQWTATNWLLHLVPGAITVGSGLLIIALARGRAAGARGAIRLCALAMILAGAWMVIGPALWPVFESGRPYVGSSDATTAFVREVGANLGPGLLVVVLGAMILEAVSAMARTDVVAPAQAAPVPPAQVAPDEAAPVKTGPVAQAGPATPAVAKAPPAANQGPGPVEGAPASAGPSSTRRRFWQSRY